jgi:glycosyltransferase involved in cell wall biosynthesis
MQILHVYKDYNPVLGGIENHMKELAEAQVAADHQVTVLVTNPGKEVGLAVMNGVRVVRVPRLATVASTPISPTFPLSLRRQPADIVHLHFPYPIGEVSQLAAGRHRPYVITYHSDVVRQQSMLRFYRPLLWRVLRGAARILATSPQYIASSPFLSQLKEKCTVVPLGINPRPYQSAEPLLPPSGKPRLLFVGRHRYYKGVGDLIQALPLIAGAELLLPGIGPMQETWRKLAAEVGVADRISFLGEVSNDDLPRLYASADLFVLPANARSEAFGIVLLEAMAAGLACVTTELGTGTSFVVQDGVTGLVVPPQEPPALAAAVNRLLADDELRRRMGENGRQRVLEQFTIERVAHQVESVYRAVLASASSASRR